jgi:KDO2-lipid IV(A) lauroyltransferase
MGNLSPDAAMNTEYLQYIAAAIVSEVLPRRFAYWVGRTLGARFCRRDDRGRRAVIANLRTIFRFRQQSCSRVELADMAQRTFQQFGKYLVDFFRYTRLSEAKVRRMMTVEGRGRLDEAVAAGNGVILVTAHLGNWEIGGAAVAALGYPINAVVLPQSNMKTNELFQRFRTKRGMTVMPLGHAARDTMRALRRGEIVAVLADRDYSRHSTPMRFFGQDAGLPNGPARLHVKTGAPILPAFLLRRPDDSFVLRFHPPIVGNTRAHVADIMGQIGRILEVEIGESPCQWFMFDNFWRRNAACAA